MPPLVDTLEFGHHVQDLSVVDARVIVRHAVTGGGLLAVGHATDELLVGGLSVATVGNARLSGVVEEGRILNPEGDVPGLVVCPTVVSGEGGGHVVCFVWYVKILQGQAATAAPWWTVCRLTSAQSNSPSSSAHLASAASFSIHREQWASDS